RKLDIGARARVGELEPATGAGEGQPAPIHERVVQPDVGRRGGAVAVVEVAGDVVAGERVDLHLHLGIRDRKARDAAEGGEGQRDPCELQTRHELLLVVEHMGVVRDWPERLRRSSPGKWIAGHASLRRVETRAGRYLAPE